MKKNILIFLSAVLFVSCSTTQKPLYSWWNYADANYNFLKKNDEKSTSKLIEMYEKIIKKQKGTRNVVPPGVYADYGFILIQANKNELGKTMLLKEIELYPESRIFIDRILKLIE
jgi:hypothetical protein